MVQPLVIGRRRDGGRWEILEGASVERVRPMGAWDTLLVVEDGPGGRTATEYVVSEPEWRAVERPTR